MQAERRSTSLDYVPRWTAAAGKKEARSKSINNRAFQIHFFYLWDFKIDFFDLNYAIVRWTRLFEFRIQEIISLRRQKALRCENFFLVDLICYCCWIDNESRAKITLQQFCVHSRKSSKTNKERRKKCFLFPRRRRQHGSETKRNTKHLSNETLPSNTVPRATNLKETQTSINFHFTERQSCLPDANLILTSTLYLTSTLRLIFDFYGTFMWSPFYCCQRNSRSQEILLESSKKCTFLWQIFITLRNVSSAIKRFLATCVRHQLDRT